MLGFSAIGAAPIAAVRGALQMALPALAIASVTSLTLPLVLKSPLKINITPQSLVSTVLTAKYRPGLSPLVPLDVDGTIISQYAASPTIIQLVHSFNDWINPDADLDNFFNLIWNVDTAQGVGLDIWGRIVGVGRVLNVATGKFFGFTEATNVSADPFNQSPFWSGGVTTTNYPLTDPAYRLLIYAKALANITDGSVKSINQILLQLFPGRGNCYVVDNNDMTMIYHFSFTLSLIEVAIVQGSGVLPKPAGVSVSVVSL